MLNSSAASRSADAFALRQHNSVNARPIWLLRCSIRFYFGGSSPVAFARTDNSGRPIPRRHPLTLIVFIYTRPIEGRGLATPFGATMDKRFNARSLLMIGSLRCSVMSSIGGSQLAFLAITDGQ